MKNDFRDERRGSPTGGEELQVGERGHTPRATTATGDTFRRLRFTGGRQLHYATDLEATAEASFRPWRKQRSTHASALQLLHIRLTSAPRHVRQGGEASRMDG